MIKITIIALLISGAMSAFAEDLKGNNQPELLLDASCSYYCDITSIHKKEIPYGKKQHFFNLIGKEKKEIYEIMERLKCELEDTNYENSELTRKVISESNREIVLEELECDFFKH